jgi:alpha-beta hydrolase superfamily lysophospholipase
MAQIAAIQIHMGWNWRRNLRRAATAAGVMLGGALASGVGLGYIVAVALTRPRKPSPLDDYVMTPYETGADFEPVTIPSSAGEHEIQGWWFPRPETNRIVICCSGYRATKSELLGIATFLWRAGFNALLFDYHGHGSGLGAPVTLGYREMHDFMDALEYAKHRMPDARIGVFGASMGASLAILGAAQHPEILAVVADSPFATHTDVVIHNVERVVRLPSQPFVRIADEFLYRMAGYRGGDVAPIRAVAAIAPRPLLLFHGTADRVIPVEQSTRVYEAAGEPKELVLGEGADHCGTYFLDRPDYSRRVIAFFRQALDAASPIEPARIAREHGGSTEAAV